MPLTDAEMHAVADGLPTKSAKIRALAAKGVARADIARFLNLRYQHVRNVLVADERAGRGVADAGETKTFDWPLTSKLDAAGRIVIPAPLRSLLRLEEGDEVVLQLEPSGEVRLLTRAAALKRARDLYRRFAPEGESLADVLIAERRRDAEDEARGR